MLVQIIIENVATFFWDTMYELAFVCWMESKKSGHKCWEFYVIWKVLQTL